jgi:hypothetical protein
MTLARRHAAVGAAGLLIAFLWRLSPALSTSDTFQVRLVCAVLTVAACTALALVRGVRPMVWMLVAAVSIALGLALLVNHLGASGACVATYDGRSIVIGREYTPAAADYVNTNRGLSASELLLDSGGDPERIWTRASIASCRFWLGWGGLLMVPLLAACVGALVARRGHGLTAVGRLPTAAKTTATVPSTPAYDAFLSYRHGAPDDTYAKEILEVLESRGLRVAIDFRDFRANEHFLSEMERCIKESRFVLCVITSRYIDSDHCSEEAVISKTLDLADKRKRLVPLLFERIELPVWLHGLVGIDCGQGAAVDPLERLCGLVTAGSEHLRQSRRQDEPTI